MHLGPFGCLTELSAKRAELVQKFVPRSCVRIFRYERTRATPLDPKLILFGAFCTIWVHLGPFSCLTELGPKLAELVRKFMPRSRGGIFRNERSRSTPLDLKLTFRRSRTIWLSYETRCKTGRTSAKVRATKLRRNLSL